MPKRIAAHRDAAPRAPRAASARHVVAVLVLALAGCGTWNHPTKSQAEFHAERTACEERAVGVYPVVLVQRQTSPGRFTPSRTTCTTNNNQTQCVTTPGRWDPPTWTTEDANAGRRSGMIDDCLRAGGWTWTRQ